MISPIQLRLPDLSGKENGEFSLQPEDFPPGEALKNQLGDILHGPQRRGYEVSIPWLGRFLLLENDNILVEPRALEKPKVLETYLVGLVLSLWLDRSPAVVLHGSAVQTPLGAVVFVGHQGAGKSTTAASFAASQAYPILCDDVIPVAPGPLIWPGIPYPKLLPDALERLYGSPEKNQDLFDGIDKYQVDFGNHGTPCPPRLLIILEVSPKQDLSLTRLKGFRKAQAISAHLQIWGTGEEKAEKLQKILEYSKEIPTFSIKRPAGKDCHQQLQEILVRECQSL